MADKNSLAHWLFENKENFKPSFVELEWPKTYCPGLYDFSTTLHLVGSSDEEVFEGRGVDIERSMALEKSVAEAVERLIFRRLKLPFLGFAVSGQNGADQHAYFEALERFFLFTHLSENRSFEAFDSVSSRLPSEVENICETFYRKNTCSKIRFFSMAAPAPYIGMVCQILTEDDPSILGFALSNNAAQSLTRAFREALANFAWYQDSRKTLSPDTILKIAPAHLKEPFLSKIRPLLEKPANSEAIPIPHLQKIEVSLVDFPHLKHCPIAPVGYLTKDLEIHLW